MEKPRGLVELVHETTGDVIHGLGQLGLLFLAAAVVGAAGAGVAVSAGRIRTAPTLLAHDALARARVIEERLFRVGLTMEWRSAGPILYQDALTRLERDASPSANGFGPPAGER